MKVLVTGSQGLVGQRIVSILNNRQNIETIVATHRNRKKIPLHTKLKNKTIHLALDICTKEDVISNVKQCKPDVIIHCAALASVDYCEENPELCYDTNVIATKHLIEAAEITNSYFIFLSTDFVFGHSKIDNKHKIKEQNIELEPLSQYGKSKVLAEQLLQQSRLNYSIIRTSLVFGIAENASRKNIITWIISNLKEETPIRMITDQWRTPTYVDALAEACVKQCTLKLKGIFHIAGNDIITPYNFACTVADIFNYEKRFILPISTQELNQKAQRPNYSALDITKAEDLLDYKPSSIENALLEIKNTL